MSVLIHRQITTTTVLYHQILTGHKHSSTQIHVIEKCQQNKMHTVTLTNCS